MDHQMGKWLYYNFAAGSFHTKKLCSRLYSTEIEFYVKQKTKNRFLSHPSSMARWKARGRLYIRRNWTFLAISNGWHVIIGNCRNRRFSKGVGLFERKFQTEGASPTSHCWCQKTIVIALSCGSNMSAMCCLVLSQSTCVTDRQTDGHN